MATSELVSIIIPTYNQAHFLKAALESVQAQTWPHWEVLVVNNFSKDQTREVTLGFNDPRIRLVDFLNEGVIAASRNLGIQMAQGEYLAFLDSDDTWHPEKLARCLDRLRTGFDLVCHGEVHFVDGETARIPFKYGPAARTSYRRLLLEGNCLSTSAIVVRRSSLSANGSFDPTRAFNTAEDYELWLRLAKAGTRIAVMDQMLGSYRIHPQSSSASATKNARASLAVITSHFAKWHERTLADHLRFLVRSARIRFFIWRTERRQRTPLMQSPDLHRAGG